MMINDEVNGDCGSGWMVVSGLVLQSCGGCCSGDGGVVVMVLLL